MLGLANKGHLGPGADGDVTIYSPDPDIERMFSMPRYVLKSGTVVIDDGSPRSAPEGSLLRSSPEYDREVIPDIERWFNTSSSIRFSNFAVSEED